VIALNSAGSPVAGFPVALGDMRVPEEMANHPLPLTFSGAPVGCDVDSDGRPEIVVGGSNRHLYALGGTGRLAKGFPLLLDGEPRALQAVWSTAAAAPCTSRPPKAASSKCRGRG